MASQSLVAFTLLFLSIALIGVSPFVLGAFPGGTDRWERLSFIGQTYGAASAIVSAAALIGVVGTLAYQAREAKRARDETRRQAVSDLLRLAMQDPDLDECWGPVPEGQNARTREQQLYTNMVVAEWEMSFETKALPERRLRAIASEMFRGPVGRHYLRTTPIDGGVPQSRTIHKPSKRRAESRLMWVAIGAAAAVVGYRLLQRRFER